MTAMTTMTERERYIQTVLFGSPDKIPMSVGGPRRSTRDAWKAQGLQNPDDWFNAMCAELGIRYEHATQTRVPLGVDFRMIPQFEEKVIEHKNGHYIVQDWMGNITEISDEFDYTYIRNAIDFVTRKWHKFPVETPADFKSMKTRYLPDAPGRFPADFKDRARKLKDRDYVLSISIPGPFWQMREWCGFEPLCMMFIEQPDFIREMADFWADYVSAMLARVFDCVTPDQIHFSEDMAYKGASMISPKMTREFLQPIWTRWAAQTRQAGVPIIDMDSDGKIDQLIPLWIESGFNLCDPIEVAAGCDIVKYRERFGRTMAYAGGVDKRCIAKGGKILEDEIARIAPVVKSGGYIPGCDHGIPPDISWKNMLHFCRLIAELNGWL
ncbi:MAG: uroporphyrinogen decarboxylase family protein [Planctomycetota bacterium]